jgi:hypothetical protein
VSGMYVNKPTKGQITGSDFVLYYIMILGRKERIYKYLSSNRGPWYKMLVVISSAHKAKGASVSHYITISFSLVRPSLWRMLKYIINPILYKGFQSDSLTNDD